MTTRYLNIEERRADLKALDAADARHRSVQDLDNCVTLLEYYRDNASARTLRRLQELGMGLPENTAPLQVSLLRYAIDRQSVTYSNPPARWLLGPSNKRLAETNDAHQLLVEAYAASQVDLALREADGLRSLLHVCLLRLYPVDELGRVECRLFTPDLVRRDPHPAIGHILAWDRAFALKLQGDVVADGDGQVVARDELWELFERQSDGTWLCAWVDEDGTFIGDEDQPFADTNFVVPYDELPAQLLYDEYPGGRAWPSPRDHRIGAIESVNSIANDLWQIVRTEAHSLIAWLNVRTQDLPRDRGPGAEVALMGPQGATPDVRVISTNPKLREGSEVLDQRIEQFLRGEGLPADEFKSGATPLTGAALKTKMAPLTEKRKRQGPLAGVDERTLFDAYRAVHNYHAPTWNQEQFPDDVRLQVELAPLDLPVDQRELIEVLSRAASFSVISRVDMTMALRSCSRAQAIEYLDQVDLDLETYPFPPGAVSPAQQTGPRTSTAPDAVLDVGDNDSVVDAVRKNAAEQAQAGIAAE